MSTLDELATEVEARLRAATDPERKRFTEGYFPSALENLGVAVPAQRALVRELKQRLKAEDGSVAVAVARAILKRRTLEGGNVAYLFLNAHPTALDGLTLADLEQLGDGIDNWTSVDTFACYVAGPVWRAGGITDADVAGWARSRDRWWRRAALAATVALNVASRGGSGDTPRTLAVCRLLVDDHDDMVVKGMSWALRSLAGHDENAVIGFLEEHEAELHARVLREVGNKLSTGLKSGRRRKA